MARIFSGVVDAPLGEVFAWHARPGAFARLAPPWVPARLAAEAASLRDGRAVLALPGGLRWVARHDPAAYDPPWRFADELASLPLSAALPWRHVHEFTAAGPACTRVTDRVFTPVPAALLRPMFGYRHRYPPSAHACCWAAKEPANSPGPANGSARSGCSQQATRSATHNSNRRCVTSSAAPARPPTRPA